MQPSDALDPNDGRYEELLSLWADLEAGLSVLLALPSQVHGFAAKINQYDRWMRGLLVQDTDIALYLLFQLAATSTTGYSASHALVCAVLCHVTAAELELAASAHDSLVRAAITMNVSITQLQDQLAGQMAKPGAEQQAALRGHGSRSSALLREHGVTDTLWLDVVARHHDAHDGVQPAGEAVHPADAWQLGLLLQLIDRYAALISPRGSRAGRNVTESLGTLNLGAGALRDRLGKALVRAVGLFPPGTFVRLNSGETAVVLRRGASPQAPVLALLTQPNGRTLPQPRLQRGPATIEAAVSAHAVGILQLNHRTLVQLGLFATRPLRRQTNHS